MILARFISDIISNFYLIRRTFDASAPRIHNLHFDNTSTAICDVVANTHVELIDFLG